MPRKNVVDFEIESLDWGNFGKTPKAVTRFTLLLTSREDPHALLLLGYCPCRDTNKLQSHNSMVSVRPE